MLQVSIVNDGPVTIIYDSKDYLKPLPPPKVKSGTKTVAATAAPLAPPAVPSEVMVSVTEEVEKVSVAGSSS
jgi:hypothetical protein